MMKLLEGTRSEYPMRLCIVHWTIISS